MLRGRCRVIVQTQWEGEPADAMIALHARRSAASIARYREVHPDRGIAVVLTGTDLYIDLGKSAEAARSLDLADSIIALQDDAPRKLPRAWRTKARVIFQSAPAMRSPPKARGRLDCVAAGHLRSVKDPLTLFAAIDALPPEVTIRFRHFGAPLEPALGQAALALQARDRRYRFRGARPHAMVRRALASAHLLVHPSLVEGGANVIVEAITAGTPVLASRVSGNVGMLGRDYRGYFAPGDAASLARQLARAVDDPKFLRRLKDQCEARRRLFAPSTEARAVRALVRGLLVKGRR